MAFCKTHFESELTDWRFCIRYPLEWIKVYVLYQCRFTNSTNFAAFRFDNFGTIAVIWSIFHNNSEYKDRSKRCKNDKKTNTFYERRLHCAILIEWPLNANKTIFPSRESLDASVYEMFLVVCFWFNRSILASPSNYMIFGNFSISWYNFTHWTTFIQFKHVITDHQGG